MRQLTKFSIIVPVYNGAETLNYCLNALINQNYPKDCYEILVVNDGSTDNTVAISALFPVRLINLGSNQGRVVARNAGAKAAKYETLIFHDVRVFSEPFLLQKLDQRGYQPLIPNVKAYGGGRWGFDRFFHLLRWKIYGCYYLPLPDSEEYFLTEENFEQRPKGTTLFVCNRDLWLASQPKETDKTTNDDTRILHKIIKQRPILRVSNITVKYENRTQLKIVFKHIFERGPRFADYYLRPGGRYYPIYLVIWLMLGLMTLMIIFQPELGILVGGLTILGINLIVTLFLSRSLTDILVVAICFPIIVSAFGLGILKWQIIKVAELI